MFSVLFFFVEILFFFNVFEFCIFYIAFFIFGFETHILSGCRFVRCALHRGLSEMGAHELLEVEVGELVALGDLKKGRESGIREDDSAVLLVLKLVGLDIGIDLASHICARHLGPWGLLKKLGKLITNSGGLHKSIRVSVSSLPLSLRVELLGSLELS